MYRALTILLFLFSTLVNAGQVEQWLEKLEKPRYSLFKLNESNLKQKYINYNYSDLLTPKREFIGFISPNYRRLKITFTSINKDKNKPDQYNVKGYSVVKNNKCNFEGTIVVNQVREYIKMHYGVDDEYKDDGIRSQGILIGRYKFKENKEQKYSGVFEGITTLYWFVDKDGKINYDNIRDYADGYKNNQYVGTWKQYNKTKVKNANWGEYRIPFSGDLDIGAGEFGVDRKYYNQGWQDFDK